tara:strand:- start:760 stop:1032 length:273 start_codon:yes stop_codon:yes gene_type:complete
MQLIDKIKNRIIDHLSGAKVEIIDQSHQHSGHGDSDKGSHFNAIIISKDFSGLNLVQRHQKIYKILGQDMGSSIHAFSMKTFTPEEFDQS